MASTQHETLHLQHFDELFEPPEADPYSDVIEVRSGIERLVEASQTGALDRPLSVTITVPPSCWSDDLEARTRRAVRLYCRNRLAQIDRDKRSMHRRGIRALQYGLLVWGACLVLSSIVEASAVLPAFLTRFLGEGIVIVGWVALWHPADLLLFSRWPLVHERRVYARLNEMQVAVKVAE